MLIYVFDEPIKCFTNPRHQSGFLLPMGHGGSEEDDSLTRIQFLTIGSFSVVYLLQMLEQKVTTRHLNADT